VAVFKVMTTSDSVAGAGNLAYRPGTLTRRPVHARRAELLDRLRDLFLAEGFAHFTLDDLAARLRCSKSTLYTLADSKEQLAVRVVAHYFKGATAGIEAKVAEVADVRARMRAYLDAAAAELRPASRDFIEDIAANSATRALYEANARAAADRVRAYVGEGVRDGVFREVHAAFVAEMVSGTIIAIQRGDIGERTGLSDAEAFAALSQFLLGGLSAELGDDHQARPRRPRDSTEES
jgi:AcrR family transcriptional regulator